MKLTESTKEAVHAFIAKVVERRREAEERRKEEERQRRAKALSEPPKHFSLKMAKRHEVEAATTATSGEKHGGHSVHVEL